MSESNNHKRFSDEQLQEFYQEFLNHREHESSQWEHISNQIAETRGAVDKLNESTEGLVTAWNDAKGTVRVVAFLGRCVMWLGGLLTTGGIVWYFLRTGQLPPEKP